MSALVVVQEELEELAPAADEIAAVVEAMDGGIGALGC